MLAVASVDVRGYRRHARMPRSHASVGRARPPLLLPVLLPTRQVPSPYRAWRLIAGAVLTVGAGFFAWWASGRLETGYIAFTATVGALLALSRYLGERPKFAVSIRKDDWPGTGDLWAFTVTNRSDREWHLIDGYVADSPTAKDGVGFGGPHPSSRRPNDLRVKAYEPFRCDLVASRVVEQFGEKLPRWAVFVDTGGDHHPVRLRWPPLPS